ncbi:VP2 [Epsilonpolyomavirus bovis]|uniref:Minor capsid protein VP2 n=6 Tax=Bovine polyomavirus TaxID=1891754 RepID=VP2_POVBO|nr:VP2 [Epsilonpolyomavirus bovis]P24849.3 RecName: Full=Minor capsid protein VP2; AltName: Full=Minor structural protein VP2 [Epsilonpolyomavirus bovis]AIT68750.1 VP2 [Bovine polyomavirus 1]ALP46096.1 viral protein 2 [Bovine polyomavirus 1]ALW83506.1 VP2 [Epsilonpolyomavirus bovis]UUA44186.1 VP2 [Bovine polyomavirus 1]BAA03037.1 VP2 [Epsilonpolyomavirus bovis]
MGALLTILAEVFELATATGLSAEAILTGEAFTTAELLQAHIANLVEVGELSVAEALAATEVTSEAFEALQSISSVLPTAFIGVAATEGAILGSLITLTATSSALYPSTWKHSTPSANLNQEMALVPYIGDLDIFFPGAETISRFVYSIDPFRWASYLYNIVGRAVWEHLFRETRRQIAYHTTDIAGRTAQSIHHTIANFLENVRWTVSHLGTNLYSGLHNYYRQLPPLNPPQSRELARRLGVPQPDRQIFEKGEEGMKHPVSAEYVEKYGAPGGAEQRVAPDWLLPLLLGLYGDLTPAWEAEVEEEENEQDEEEYEPPQKRIKRTAKSSSKVNNKRGDRSARSPYRTRQHNHN